MMKKQFVLERSLSNVRGKITFGNKFCARGVFQEIHNLRVRTYAFEKLLLVFGEVFLLKAFGNAYHRQERNTSTETGLLKRVSPKNIKQ